MPGSDRAQLLARLATIVRAAGEVALTASKSPVRSWMKTGDSPVSDADIAVNDLLQARLPSLVPSAGWLSEETEDNAARTGGALLWVVDPIDGTRAFLAGLPNWTISVALVEDGRPALAALYAPATDEMFLAVRGAGATCNGKTISATLDHSLSGASSAGPASYLKRLAELRTGIAPQPKIHSLALRFARVAQGTIDVALASSNSHDWDLAAADLLVHEAGGALTDFRGRPVSYNQTNPVHGTLIAAGRARHQTLLELVRDRQSEFA